MKNLLRAAFPDDSILSLRTIDAIIARSKLYAIFVVPRSGSTWLMELLKNAGSLGVPQEWFNEDWIYSDELALGCRSARSRKVKNVNTYVADIVDEGSGVAGVQLSVRQTKMLLNLLEAPFDTNALTSSFYLRRKDIVAQAISLFKSASSGRFHSYENSNELISAYNDVKYNQEGIAHWLQHIIENEICFDKMFFKCGLQPTTIFYEDLCSNPLKTLNDIAKRLGSPAVRQLPRASLSVMRDARNYEWHERFLSSAKDDVHQLLAHRAMHCDQTSTKKTDACPTNRLLARSRTIKMTRAPFAHLCR